MINYLASFLPDLSERTAIRREVLDKNSNFEWMPNHDDAYKKPKSLVSSKTVLQYYDLSKGIKIHVMSQKGLGAVLLQKHRNNWLPVAYASRATTETESQYAPIEREAWAIIYTCEHFH